MSDIHPHGYWLRDCGHYKDLELAWTLAEFFGHDSSVLDLGCGLGVYVRVLNHCNIRCVGVDGNPLTPTYESHCVVGDLTEELNLGMFDWVLSLEVGEHIPEEFCDRYLRNISKHCRKGAVVSWAIPGQGGSGHVNERPNDWVRDKFRLLGFSSDQTSEMTLRKYATASWFKDTIMVFRKDQ